ncbi:hypothetical protein FE257_012262 [Aspergillus nanangensis]|uniref:Uncharacterized protein n=1 Tax=Aspergillus nanangensis TaxID=2582783 RepID=A0AAD4GQV5_ASPNN|nr:hypothetical protein FE257_012262 [Aspergillus nanangensis]
MISLDQPLDIHLTSSYTQDACSNVGGERITAQSIDARLYSIAPNYDVRRVDAQGQQACYPELRTCVALICQQMLAASQQLECAFPMRVGLDYDEPYPGAPQHWAIKLIFTSGQEILLPVSISLKGSVRNDVAPDTLYLQGWTIDHAMLKCTGRTRANTDTKGKSIRKMNQFYQRSLPIFEKFRLSPVLYISDVDMLFLPTEVIHSSYRYANPLSPVYGTFTDIFLVVDEILDKAPRVVFTIQPERPFQLVKLEEFKLEHEAHEDMIISESLHHPTGNGLTLKDIEDYFHDEGAVPALKKDYRSRLRHALKLGIQKGFDIVDKRRRCLFFTCPHLPEFQTTYYCRYHSAAIIRHALKEPDLPLVNMSVSAFSKPEALITEKSRHVLEKLKAMYSKPEMVWIMDFEYISMPGNLSPIPLQLAIRNIDGGLVYSANVDYGLSMEDLMEQLSKMMGTLFLRCYNALETNGQKISAIRRDIFNNCGYTKNNIQLLSWLAS